MNVSRFITGVDRNCVTVRIVHEDLGATEYLMARDVRWLIADLTAKLKTIEAYVPPVREYVPLERETDEERIMREMLA